MSEYISREAVLSLIKQACNPYGKPTIDFEVGKRMMQVVKQMPSANIIECARAIKEYCKERTNKPFWCNDCPLYEPFCKINIPPNMWDLPEGEKENERSDDK